MQSITFAAALLLLRLASAGQFVMYTAGGDHTDNAERADPIISPGTISGHVHQIFGSNAFSPDMSYDSLQGADCTTVADASGNGNADDRSVYWHPALYMEASNGTGYIRVPTNGHKLYYQDAGVGTKREPFEFPHGFRMMAGNPFMRAAAADVQQQNITQWVCHSDGPWNQGTDGGFPTGVQNCASVDGFNGAIHFPHCWNGQDFDQAKPTAHVVYPMGDISHGECPSSHPTRLPHIFIENTFNLDAVYGQVKPDSFVLAQGDNTGYGWHADFYNGWVDGAIPQLLQCPQGKYGNEDVGSCPGFKKNSAPANQCQLKTFYPENVNAPGKNLPGCNPISDHNPAPMYAPAPLGTYSTNCATVGGQAGGGSIGQSPSPSPTSVTTKTSPTPVGHTTTTSRTSPSPSPTTTGSSFSLTCPASNNKVQTVNGKKFTVQCGVDHAGGDLQSTSASTLGDCVAACANNTKCVAVAMRGRACYLKSSVGKQIADGGVNGAMLITTKHKRVRTVRHQHRALHARWLDIIDEDSWRDWRVSALEQAA